MLSHVQLFVTPLTAGHQASLSFAIFQSLLKCMSIELVMPFNHFIPVAPFSSCPQSSSIRVSSRVLALCVRWPKYWSFSISLSNEFSGLISFRIDWFDFLAVKGTLKSSLAPEFESINYWSFGFLNGATLTSVDDYWKNHNLDYVDLCCQSDVSAF